MIVEEGRETFQDFAQLVGFVVADLQRLPHGIDRFDGRGFSEKLADITASAALNGSLANNPAKVYGASEPAPGGLPITLSGFVNNPAIVTWNGNVSINDTANLTGTLTSYARVAGENTGSYNFTGGTLALSGLAAANYAGAVFVPGASALNITPASLTITADDKSRPLGVPNPPFTASYAGFQFGETSVALSGVIAFATPSGT